MFPSSSSSSSSLRDISDIFSLPPSWTLEEDEKFEEALATYEADTPNKWERIADLLPGKTAQDVYERYMRLSDDLKLINAWLVQLPEIMNDVDEHEEVAKENGTRGIPWTMEEHKLFLVGLQKYGSKNLSAIANVVQTRTADQVKSHQYRFFRRQADRCRRTNRRSIFDITQP